MQLTDVDVKHTVTCTHDTHSRFS